MQLNGGNVCFAASAASDVTRYDAYTNYSHLVGTIYDCNRKTFHSE